MRTDILSALRSGSKLFAMVISKRQKSPLARKEFNVNKCVQLHSGAKYLEFVPNIQLLPYFVYTVRAANAMMTLRDVQARLSIGCIPRQ